LTQTSLSLTAAPPVLGVLGFAPTATYAVGICWLDNRFDSIGLSAAPLLDIISSLGLMGAVLGGT